MRTMITLDDDVAALIENERVRTGEPFRQVVNRLLRVSVCKPTPRSGPLPLLPGRPAVDVADVSVLLSTLADERLALRTFDPLA
jgi:hypothetical protein